MRLLPEEQGLAETTGEIRLERRNPGIVQPFPTAGAAGKAIEFAGISAAGHDQRSPAVHMAGQCRLPPIGGRAAKRQHGLLRTFPFTPRRQHAAGKAGGAGADFFGALCDRDVEAVAIQLPGDRQAGNAGPLDEDAHGHSPAGVLPSGM
jgi:hypothetical protein